jgi:AmmeMemoRadiSam system protein A
VTARAGRDPARLDQLAAGGVAALDLAGLALDDEPPPSGVFVTLHRFGQLRGCIGQLGSDRPLQAATVLAASAAAADDPRFPAVAPSELPTIALEISVLSPLQPVEDVMEIEVGRHGLIVERGNRRGLLLPQVATEWGWDRDTFLSQTCVKAGLPADAWRRGVTIWRFEAEVFGEGER